MTETLTEEDLSRYIIRVDKTEDVGRSYIAFDETRREPVWVRLVTLGPDEAVVGALAHDLDRAVNIRHPNIVRLTRYGIFGREAVAVYEFVNGLTLSEIVTDSAPSPRQQIAERLAPQLIIGVRETHRHGIAHWGINQTNVLLTTDGEVKIADVGLAVCYRDHVQTIAARKGVVPPSVPPELVEPGKAEISSDYYSISMALSEFAGYVSDIMPAAVRMLAPIGTVGTIQDAFRILWRRRPLRFSKPMNEILERFLNLDPNQRDLRTSQYEMLEKLCQPLSLKHKPIAEPLINEILTSPMPVITLLDEVRSEQRRVALAERLRESRRQIASAMVATIDAELEQPSTAEKKTPGDPDAGRFVDLWTNPDGNALQTDIWCDFNLQIVTSARHGPSAKFVEPTSDATESTELLVNFYSDDVEIEKRHHTLMLPPSGESSVVTTRIRPHHPGICKVEVMISLAHELELLQVLVTEIAVEVPSTVDAV